MKLQWLSPIEHLERFDSVIDRDDIDQLRLYFKLDGMSSITRSPLGGMLDNAMMFAPNYKPCKYCGGKQKTDEDDSEEGGIGILVGVDGWDKRTRKSYESIVGKSERAQKLIVDGADCAACGTRGWIQTSRHQSKNPITAQPRGDEKIHRSNVKVNMDVVIGTCAVVSSILDRADVLFPLTSSALASIHGLSNFGSIGLWHITPAGKTLLRGNYNDLTPEAYFIGVRTENEDNKKKGTTELLKLAEQQATWLKEYSCRSWNAATLVYRCGS